VFNISGRALLHVEKLKKYFPIKEGIVSRVVANVKAVDRVSFHINEGETFGVVGESGCGKSTMGLSILRLIEPTSGRILFDMPAETLVKVEELQNIKNEMNPEEYKEKMNELLNPYDVRIKTKKEMQELRRNMQIVFQDPYGALNPRMNIKQNITIILKTHFKEMSQMERDEKAADLLIESSIKIGNFESLSVDSIKRVHSLSCSAPFLSLDASIIPSRPNSLIPSCILDISRENRAVPIL
jgi:ABC-type oligopeptide transport system ATPase subunit